MGNESRFFLRDLELAARVHVNKLWHGELDAQGWNTLAAHLNMCHILARDDRFSAAMQALESIRQRHVKTGVYGATGDERRVIMEQFNRAVEYLGSRTDKQVAEAVNAMYRMAA